LPGSVDSQRGPLGGKKSVGSRLAQTKKGGKEMTCSKKERGRGKKKTLRKRKKSDRSIINWDHK